MGKKGKRVDDKKRDFYQKRVMWSLIFGLFLLVAGHSMNVTRKIVDGNYLRSGSLRLFGIMFVLFVCLITFLFCRTSRDGDISQNMIDEWPIAAFSRSGTIFVMAIASFHFFIVLLGIMGIPYFIAFWGFTLNTVMILPL